jgi:hypothetical protein
LLGHPPAIAMFATNARYKRESYRGSEFAAKILNENGLDVVLKVGHEFWQLRVIAHVCVLVERPSRTELPASVV